MKAEAHALQSTRTFFGGTVVKYTCTCGSSGRATQAYAGDDVLAKAKRNHKSHASRARKRAKAG